MVALNLCCYYSDFHHRHPVMISFSLIGKRLSWCSGNGGMSFLLFLCPFSLWGAPLFYSVPVYMLFSFLCLPLFMHHLFSCCQCVFYKEQNVSCVETWCLWWFFQKCKYTSLSFPLKCVRALVFLLWGVCLSNNWVLMK